MGSGTSKCIVLYSHASTMDGFYCLTVKNVLYFWVCFFSIHQIKSLQSLKKEIGTDVPPPASDRLEDLERICSLNCFMSAKKNYEHGEKVSTHEEEGLLEEPLPKLLPDSEFFFFHLISRCRVTAFRASNIICYTSGKCRLLYSLHQNCRNCFFLPSFPFTSLPS